MEDPAGYEQDRKRLAQRIAAVQGIIRETADPQERLRQTERLRILRGMYRDVLDNLERLRPPEEKKRRARAGTFSADACSWDFFERAKTCFSDIEGTPWRDLEDGGLTAAEAAALQRVLAKAWGRLTDKQRFYLSEKLAGRTVTEIAAESQVRPSTVTRTLARAEGTLLSTVCAHGFVGECLSDQGFDLLRFVSRAALGTERQRELLYFLLTDGCTLAEAARIVERNPSTLCRCSERIVQGLEGVGLSLEGTAPRKIRRRDWPGETEAAIAAALGVSKGFFYRFVCREGVGPYSRYEYELLERRGRMSAAEAAADLGISRQTVLKHWAAHPGEDVSALPRPRPYQPGAPPYRAGEPSLRKALAALAGGENTIGGAVSAETYRRMLRRSEGG